MYGSGWDDFYKLYPESQGIISFSKVGFSKDGMQALVFANTARDYENNSGELIILVKIEGKWVIQLRECIWVA